MKNVAIAICMLASGFLMAQANLPIENYDWALANKLSKEVQNKSLGVPVYSMVQPYYFEVTDQATTSLVFPSKIVAIDRGSDQILSKKVEGVENVLKVKAGKAFEKPTNLTVITDDGKIYAFSIAYQYLSTHYVIDMRKVQDAGSYYNGSTYKERAKFESTGMNGEEIKNLSRQILSGNARTIETEKESNVILQIKQIFVKDDIVFIPVQIINKGDLNYDIDLIKFFVKDKKRTKRTINQTLELSPVYVFNETDKVQKNDGWTQVFAFNKFTINRKKKLDIVVYEENGGRNITATLKFRDIDKAKFID
jgi:conjugative transposon TraN protein